MLESGEIRRVGSSKVRHVDVRVISATNASIGEAVARGDFREDLLYRLNTVEIELPPLRDRPEDIPLLARHFLERQATRYGRAIVGFSPGAEAALAAHAWPGNVRELHHSVERAVVMARGSHIEAADLRLRGREGDSAALADVTLEEAERILVRRALDRHDGNVSRAARALGLTRSSLYRRLKRIRPGEDDREPVTG